MAEKKSRGKSRRVTFEVRTAQALPVGEQIFVTGNQETLGKWRPDGYPLTRMADLTWQGTVVVPPDEIVEYKVTRGSWDTEEVTATGIIPSDSKIKPGAIDLATFSKHEASFGEAIFKEHACIGCHQIQEGAKTVGGLQSTSLANAGRRLKADWIYRFNSNPPDYVPHSGEFVGDVSELGLRYVTGFIATRGWDDFPFYEPWTSEPFGHPSADRGKVIYREYCAQCHGAAGKGDGPAAPGLSPKPAIHANMAFDKLPTEYLYNVIYYGGRSVGKAATMPYWGLTIGQEGVADVIAYLRETFKGGEAVAQSPAGGA